MSDAVLVAIIGTVGTIIVAIINRPPPPKKKDSIESDEVKNSLDQIKYTYSVRLFFLIVLVGGLTTFSGYTYFDFNDRLSEIGATTPTQLNPFDPSEINSRIDNLENSLNQNAWSDVRLTDPEDFNPACKYRVRVNGLTEGDSGYSRGYHYITTVTQTAMWTSWIGRNIEIGNKNGVLTITSGRFENMNFTLQINCFN